MADQKLTALSAFTPALTDIIYGVDDPSGSPVSGKLTLTSIRDLFEANPTTTLVQNLFEGVRATKSADQSISNASEANVTWNQEDYDTEGMHSTSSTNYNFTIPSGWAKIDLDVLISWGVNSTGFRAIYVYQGASIVSADAIAAASGSTTTHSASLTGYPVTPGDVFKVTVFQNSGGSLTVSSTATHIAIRRAS